MTQSVRRTPEVDRILALPRRVQPTDLTALIADVTAALKRVAGDQTLFGIQALAIFEALLHNGLIGNIDVGEGKTLITFVLAHVLEAERPLLLLPAKLIEKTVAEHAAYAKHWHVTPLKDLTICSYEKLGLVQYKTILDDLRPDLVMGDEAHNLKDDRAARTKVFARYMKANPATKCVWLSGTFMQRSVTDFAHLARWALKGGAPVPATKAETDDWAWALDDKLDPEVRWHPGALLKFCAPVDEVPDDLVATARKGFQRRLRETPGVVTSTHDPNSAPCAITISAVTPDYQPDTEANFARLRGAWSLPDGWPLESPTEVWAHAREMAVGMYYVWDPRPPKPWLEARREWSALVTETLSRSRTLDSERHFADTIDAGKFNDGGVLARWRKIQRTFRINQRAVWFDDSALDLCVAWLDGHTDGIVWVEHVAFGRELARRTGRKYYGAEGRAADGELLTVDVGPGPVIASIRANREGRNLQRWSANLVTAPPDLADVWQQLIGRTHRKGQRADEVTVEIFLGCLEHASAFRNAMSGAVTLRDTVGARSKLLLADVVWPTVPTTGARWRRVAPIAANSPRTL